MLNYTLSYTLVGTVLALMTVLPLQWRLRAGDVSLRRTAFIVIVWAIPSALVVSFLGNLIPVNAVLQVVLVWFLTVALMFATVAYYFYRDPERLAPDHHDVIVSPADGKVKYVREARGGVLPVSSKHGHNYTLHELTKTPLQSEDAMVIGISMSFLDVHVNRAPIAGRIALRRHFPGRFQSLKGTDVVFENERATTLIERDGLEVAVVQIASKYVRQIASFVPEGQDVALGQRIGVIRLGSQVDLVLPIREGLKIMVQPGEQVKAGESVIAVYGSEGVHTTDDTVFEYSEDSVASVNET